MNEELVAQTHYRLIEALAQEDQCHRRRMDHLQDVVFETDASGVLVYLNRAWERLLGIPVAESLGRSLRGFIAAEDHPAWDRLDGLQPGTWQVRPIQLRFSHPVSKHLCMELTASRGADGSWVGSIRDLTERNRQAEAAMSRSRVLEHLSTGGSLDECLHAIAHHITVLIPGHPVSILLVVEREKLLQPVASIGLPAFFIEAHRGLAIDSDLGACGPGVFLKQRVIIEDTEMSPNWRPYLALGRAAGIRACCAQPVFSSRGSVLATIALYARQPEIPDPAVLGTLADTARLAGIVIEHKQMEMQLLTHSVAVQHSPAAVFVTDAAGVIQYINPRFVELTGYTESDAIGRTPRILKSGMHSAEHYRQLWFALGRGETWRGEFCNRKRGGDHFWQSFAIAPIRDNGGHVTGYVAIAEDISSQKEVARQLQLALTREQEAGELKSRFLSMTSHEFRTPMSSIQLAFDLLRDLGSQLPESRRQDLFSRVDAAVQRMRRMLDASLMISRVNTGKMPFKPVPVDMVELVEKIIEECRQTDDKKHEIEFRCDVRAIQVMADPDICWNIVTNLLRNACSYSSACSVVTVSLARAQGVVTLAVEDRGIGIPEEDQRRVFASFERGSNVGSIKGTGLGLSIVKRLVEVHGGGVSFESKLGCGTRFTISLPDLPADVNEAP